MERRAAQLSPELARALLHAFRLLRDSMNPAELARLIERGDVEAAIRLAFSDEIVQRAFYPVRERIRRGTLDAARAQARTIPLRPGPAKTIGIAFDVLDPRVLDAIRTIETGSIGFLQGEVRAAARQVVTDGLTRGVNPREVARSLRDVVGLTSHQERIIDNFGRALTEADYAKALQYELRDKRFDPTLRRLAREGRTLTPKQVEEHLGAYRRRFVARNAETHARTAALESQRVGQQLAWGEAKAQGALGTARVIKVWVATLDDRTRPEHAAMHHAEADIDGTYSNGDHYPGESNPWNCRCTEVYRVARAA